MNEQLAKHFKKHWLKWLFVGVLAFEFSQHFMIGFNISPSLPQSVFLIVKGAPVSKGDYVTFKWHGQGGYYAQFPYFTKIMKGVEGDIVTAKGREIFINGELVGMAQEKSSLGVDMDMVQPRVIAKGEFFAYVTHPRSLDSRYSIVGYIPTGEIIGRAYPLF